MSFFDVPTTFRLTFKVVIEKPLCIAGFNGFLKPPSKTLTCSEWLRLSLKLYRIVTSLADMLHRLIVICELWQVSLAGSKKKSV